MCMQQFFTAARAILHLCYLNEGGQNKWLLRCQNV
jgi:hypothetical protein